MESKGPGSAAGQPAAGEDGGADGATDAAGGGERSWLAALVLSRAFVTLIFMTYAASLPTLTREWAMSATQAGLVQTSFSAGFAISLYLFDTWRFLRRHDRERSAFVAWLVENRDAVEAEGADYRGLPIT